MNLATREADAAFADLICADAQWLRRGVRRAYLGPPSRAPARATTRAARGPAEPRRTGPAIPAARGQAWQTTHPSHREGPPPPALTSGA